MSPADRASAHKPLRQRAAEKLHGASANPSQLGDPVSLKAETSSTDLAQTSDDADAALPTRMRTPPPSSGGSHEEKKLRGGRHVRGMLTDEIRRGEVGPPRKSLEGDATSLKAETVERDPVPHDNGGDWGHGGKGKGKASKL